MACKQFQITYGPKNLILNAEQLFQASKDLTGSGIKLYIYLNSFVDEENTFSPINCQQTIGLSLSSIHRAFKELQEKGYLIKEDDNSFIFTRGKSN